MADAPLARIARRTARALRRRGLARLVIGVWLAVHGFVVTAAPIADAMLGDATTVVPHWEDAQETSCPPQHDPATCQLCQQVTLTITDEVASPIGPVPVVRVVEVKPRASSLGASDVARCGVRDPRGPPAV